MGGGEEEISPFSVGAASLDLDLKLMQQVRRFIPKSSGEGLGSKMEADGWSYSPGQATIAGTAAKLSPVENTVAPGNRKQPPVKPPRRDDTHFRLTLQNKTRIGRGLMKPCFRKVSFQNKIRIVVGVNV